MGMQVYKAWSDRVSDDINGLIITLRRFAFAYPGDLTVSDSYVELAVNALSRINEMSVLYQDVFHSSLCLPLKRYKMAMRTATPFWTCSLITDLWP